MIVGMNSAGLISKKESFFNIVNLLSPSIITVQETKHTKVKNIKIPGYQSFERIRNGKTGGGLLTSVTEDLDPVLIYTASDDTEIMTVEIKIGTEYIRIINGYGPQEYDEARKILSFWQELEAEVVKAKDLGRKIIIQMDANAKLGSKIIKGCPHNISNNGQLLKDLVERQDLVVANALEICKGSITRERTFENKTEKSIIDYIIISRDLSKTVTEMKIDEDKEYVLARYIKTRSGTKIINSDHNMLSCRFSLVFNKKPKKIRQEFFKYKNEEDRKKFLKETSESTKFRKCFDNTENFEISSNKFFKTLKNTIQNCFKKVRVVQGQNKKLGNPSIQEKLKQNTKLKAFLKINKCKADQEVAESRLSEIEETIANELASYNAETVKDYVENMENLDSSFSQLGLWKLKKKLCSKIFDPPMAKNDKNGNLVTSTEALKNLYLETYKNRLKHREMKEEYMDIYFLKSELWKYRLQYMRKNKSKQWSMTQLEKVLKSLKNNKSMDPNGMINEIFKEGYIGSDLKTSLLVLFNYVKSTQTIPMYMALGNITTIYKSKGSRQDMNSDRGIFILTVLKKILDKLIYHENYKDIDKNMSDSNIGSRKKRNIKDHLLIIHGVINSVVKGKEEPIDIQIYDLEKAFDALWLEDCLNDVYDNIAPENRNDKLSLLNKTNKVNMIAVKTAVGLTDRINIPSVVQQGGTWGPLLCSNSIDVIGKKCRDRGQHFYLYKKTVKILPLAFIDDLNGIAKCGSQSLSLNSFINTQIELKKLRFGENKCHKLHIGKDAHECPALKVHGRAMQEVKDDKYLGDILSCDGKNSKNIKDRISKGIGIISNIFNLLDVISFGKFNFEIAMLLRNSMLINGTLTNAEVWYNFSQNEIKEFEQLDQLFFSKLLEVPKTTPSEAYYLEMGVLPINAIIKGRRVNYLHEILSRDTNSMLYNFFITQWLNPIRGDWTLQVQEDLEDLNIPCSFEYIKNKSTESFKRLVKKKVQQYALKELKNKQKKHSKMANVSYDSIKMQTYFSRSDLNADEKRTIFKYRVRMERFGENFRGGASSIPCPLCDTHPDSQEASFQCPIIRKEIAIKGSIKDIYEEKIETETIKTIMKISKYRLENLPTS